MTTDAVGGVFTYSIELASALRSFGIETTLAVMGPALRPAQRRAAKDVATLYESTFALEWMQGSEGELARAGEWLLELERATSPDVIHVNGFVHCALPWRAPVVMAVHSCVCSWWRACRGETAPQTWDHYRKFVQAGLMGADAIVAPTRAMLDSFLAEHEAHRVHGDRTHVISNASNANRYQTPRRKISLALAAGRLWDEAKNISLLNRVAPLLPWPVAVAGDDIDEQGRRVPFTGCIGIGVLSPSTLTEWMMRSSIFVLPARYEPFGLSALEAALGRCALVLGDIPSLREVWNDAAIFIDPNDPAALRFELCRLMRDKSALSDAQERAYRQALLYGDPIRFAERYAALYTSLMAAHGSDPVRVSWSTACA
jgi:hypothetical protein